MNLPRPCRFFPLAPGKYEVAAGLRTLGTDFGNGPADAQVFLFDEHFATYRAAKLRAREENLSRYFQSSSNLCGALQTRIVRFIVETLAREHPKHFQSSDRTLHCSLTQETLSFDADWNLLAAPASVQPPYRNALDALASQLQEDLAIWVRDPVQTQREWLAAIHLCFPNHWAAEEKIGRSFVQVHAPVAGFERLAKAAPSLVDGMISKGPFVRFAWGVATDRELNHHPQSPFQGRQFDPSKPAMFVRIERQTLTPFVAEHGSLFTIRTYFLDAAKDLDTSERRALASAIRSMTPESLVYKGLTASHGAILNWLENPA